jgi:hypothetical protein
VEQGIRKQIKLSKDSYRNFTGMEIDEPFGFMPKDEFERKYAEFKSNSFNFPAVENAVGIVSRFNRKELESFIQLLEEETGYAIRYSYKEECI